MIIECDTCNAKVDAKVESEVGLPLDGDDPKKVVLAQCPLCQSPLLGFTEIVQTGPDEYEWLPAERIWPSPSESWHDSIPIAVRKSLRDASRCFKAQVYPATTVMAGRAIEALCKEKVGAPTLATGLKELRDQGLIDEKIWNWANALRLQRNLGAHAADTEVTREDAKDVLDFANAICDYVYVLAQQFDEYMARRARP